MGIRDVNRMIIPLDQSELDGILRWWTDVGIGDLHSWKESLKKFSLPPDVGWETRFLLGPGLFSGYVLFREGNTPHNKFDKHLVKLYDISKIPPPVSARYLARGCFLTFDFWECYDILFPYRMPCLIWKTTIFMESGQISSRPHTFPSPQIRKIQVGEAFQFAQMESNSFQLSQFLPFTPSHPPAGCCVVIRWSTMWCDDRRWWWQPVFVHKLSGEWKMFLVRRNEVNLLSILRDYFAQHSLPCNPVFFLVDAPSNWSEFLFVGPFLENSSNKKSSHNKTTQHHLHSGNLT